MHPNLPTNQDMAKHYKKRDLELPIICVARMKLGPIYFLKKKITHNLNIVHENINNYIE